MGIRNDCTSRIFDRAQDGPGFKLCKGIHRGRKSEDQQIRFNLDIDASPPRDWNRDFGDSRTLRRSCSTSVGLPRCKLCLRAARISFLGRHILEVPGLRGQDGGAISSHHLQQGNGTRWLVASPVAWRCRRRTKEPCDTLASGSVSSRPIRGAHNDIIEDPDTISAFGLPACNNRLCTHCADTLLCWVRYDSRRSTTPKQPSTDMSLPRKNF
jgi:hypothetical protein